MVDYGCADLKYRNLFGPDVNYLAAVYPATPTRPLRYAPDGSLPLDAASVDVVFSSQVLEHVPDPSRSSPSAARVLRPGGKLLLSTHGIMVYHRDPVDYWRWTGEGLQHIVADAGFEIVRFEGVMGLAATGLQLFQDGTCHKVPRRLQPTYLGIMQTLGRCVRPSECGESGRGRARLRPDRAHTRHRTEGGT